MIHDNVENDFDALRLCAVNECLEVGIGSPVRIDSQEVIDPVAVVGRAVSLHPLLFEWRRDPDGCETKLFDSCNTLAGCAATGKTL